MTRKDYSLIAEALRNSLLDYESAQPTSLMRNSVKTNLNNVFDNVASVLAADNPHFNRDHFLAVVRGHRDLNSRPARQDKDRTPEQGSPRCYDIR